MKNTLLRCCEKKRKTHCFSSNLGSLICDKPSGVDVAVVWEGACILPYLVAKKCLTKKNHGVGTSAPSAEVFKNFGRSIFWTDLTMPDFLKICIFFYKNFKYFILFSKVYYYVCVFLSRNDVTFENNTRIIIHSSVTCAESHVANQ